MILVWIKAIWIMWYNRLNEYLLKERYVNNLICSCIFIKKSKSKLTIIVVFVGNLKSCWKNEFEMKDFGKTKFCLGLKIVHFPNRVLVHRSTYIKKILKHFHMDKTHLLCSLMVVWSLEVKKGSISLLRK